MSGLAILLLAAGASQRFDAGDKLLAPLAGRAMMLHSAKTLRQCPADFYIAVTPVQKTPRSSLLVKHGWQTVAVPSAVPAQSESLKTGIAEVRRVGVDRVIIALADMPLVTRATLSRIRAALDTSDAVMCQSGGILLPPAGFSAAAFDALETVTGDAGARSIFSRLTRTTRIDIPEQEAMDIDTVHDLQTLEAQI